MLIVWIIGLVINFTGLIIWIYLNSKKTIRYVDRSGIVKNPPTFIETLENKTLNFNYNGIIIRIAHLPFVEQMKWVSKISGLFNILQLKNDDATAKAFEKYNIKSVDIITIVDSIAVALYQLSKSQLSFWERIGRKKWMKKKARENASFIVGLSGEIFDYWQYLGNEFALRARGATLRMIHGPEASANTIKKDIHGNRLITPRHDSSSYISKTNLKSSNTKSTRTQKTNPKPNSPERN